MHPFPLLHYLIYLICLIYLCAVHYLGRSGNVTAELPDLHYLIWFTLDLVSKVSVTLIQSYALPDLPDLPDLPMCCALPR